MDVLKKIHHWLRLGGILLDLHPEPEPPVIEVVVRDVRVAHLGRIDTSALVGNIHAARAALASSVSGGWFESERSVVFDFVSHFSSVDEWLRHREERRSTSTIQAAVIARARKIISQRAEREIRVSERVLATRLRRGQQ